MADVARLAGVAPITVSRVANGRANVEEKTRQRVLEAMHRLGYRPNTAARALATGRFGMLGVITFSLATYGNSKTVNAIVTAAEERGYSVCLLPVGSATQDDVQGAVDRLAKQAVDGVIVIVEARLLDSPALSLPPGVPIVVADSGGASKYRVVDSDQSGGARSATQHLLDLGHENVWHIAGPRSSFAATSREAGWRETLLAHGIVPPEVLLGDWTTASGYHLGRELAGNSAVTAVFAANDHMALGLLRALHEKGRRIPEDVSVVGFDCTDDSDSYWPPLTTVYQDFAEVGRRCVDSLVQEIEHEDTRLRQQIVPTSLVLRQSTQSVSASQ
jgi:DNA-binding LacI/PurR family transcriptional regulator